MKQVLITCYHVLSGCAGRVLQLTCYCVLSCFQQSDMAVPIENVWQSLARATRMIFSHIAHVGKGLSHPPRALGRESYCHGANALMIDA